LTLPGVIPPTLVPKAVDVPPVLTEGPWQVQHIIPFLISRLLIICRRLILCRPVMFMLAPLPSLKVNPAGPEGIPDRICFKHGHAGTYLKLPREAKSDSFPRNLQPLCHCKWSHQVMVHSVITTCHHCHNWPSGTVTGTAAPRRAAMWRSSAETVGVVEHYHRTHDHRPAV
jgi:hypothetical protein